MDMGRPFSQPHYLGGRGHLVGAKTSTKKNAMTKVCVLLFVLHFMAGCSQTVTYGRLYEPSATFTELRLVSTSDIAEIRSEPETVLWRGDADLFFADGEWEYTEYKTVQRLIIDPPTVVPSSTPGPIAAATVVRISNHSLRFEFDRSRLLPDAKRTLDQLSYKGVDRVRLDGHTDGLGATSYNKALSSRRAKSVQTYLESKGWPASLFDLEAHGEQVPIASNHSRVGRALNRRVEIRLSLKELPQ